MSKKGWIGIIAALVVFMTLLSGCFESEYEKAGKEFNTWIKKDPRSWTDTQKKYYNDFMDWADKN